MNNTPLNRRKFLKASGLTVASLGLLPGLRARAEDTNASANINANAIGANNDIRVAVVGFNGRGREHISGFREVKGVRIVALCDVDQAVLDKGIKNFEDHKQPVKTYQDLRKLLDDKDVDAISIATPNHWHSLAAIWALQAGKDVYVEKPISHNVWEGQQLVKAAQKYPRIVQAGTQSRSHTGLREAVAWIQAGNLGKIKSAHGLCYKRRTSIGKTTGPQPIPKTVDYDLWCGPTPVDPLRRTRLHYDWHWFWQTGNGDLGNQGIHQMDVARWVLGEKELSPRILSVGGRLGYEDDGETPNTLVTFHDYPAAPLIFEVRGLPTRSGSKDMDNYRGGQVGVVVECEHGYAVIPAGAEVTVFDNDNKQIKKFTGGVSHFENFIAAVRSRKNSDLNAPILEGHVSSALCHTGNISYQLGNIATPDTLKDAVRSNGELGDTIGRMQEHLGTNGVDLSKTPLTVGELLTMNPKTEKFEGNADANTRLKGTYRAPFVVPENV